jgi:hypothetical protein
MEKKITKKAMIDYIEQSGMVVGFSRSYFNHMLKEEVAWFYDKAIAYNRRKQNQ